jgi:hypothetical protein
MDFAFALGVAIFVYLGIFALLFLLVWLIFRKKWSKRTQLLVSGLAAAAVFTLLLTLPTWFYWASSPMAPPPSTSGHPLPSPLPSPPSHQNGPTVGGPTTESSIPLFPWPPPPPSVFLVVPSEMLMSATRSLVSHFITAEGSKFGPEKRKEMTERLNLGEVDIVLRESLRKAGYDEMSHYEVPQGFALVAQLERTNEDGTPFPQLRRFDSNFRPLDDFTLEGYLRALFLAPPGYYRVIVFIVSPTPFAAQGSPISAREASLLVEGGANALPWRISVLPLLPETVCTALVYEFEKRDGGSNPIERRPGRLSAKLHLVNSKIWENLWTFP